MRPCQPDRRIGGFPARISDCQLELITRIITEMSRRWRARRRGPCRLRPQAPPCTDGAANRRHRCGPQDVARPLSLGRISKCRARAYRNNLSPAGALQGWRRQGRSPWARLAGEIEPGIAMGDLAPVAQGAAAKALQAADQIERQEPPHRACLDAAPAIDQAIERPEQSGLVFEPEAEAGGKSAAISALRGCMNSVA